MSGPPRWRDTAGGASPEIRGLLGAARRSGQLPSATKASSAARVAHLASTPAALTTAASLKGIASAAGLGAAAVVVLGAASLLETPPTKAPPVTATAAPPLTAPTTAAPRATAPATAAPAVPVPATSTSAPRRAPSGSPAPAASSDPPPAAPSQREAADTLVREAALLEQARSALAGDPVRAQARLDEHAATFPAGKLGLEREMMAVDALRRLGRADEARARAEALLSRAGGTPYEARARRLLEDLR